MLPIHQGPTSVHLPFFEADLPLLYSDDGYPCIPSFAACRFLGIDHEREVRHTRSVLLWGTVQKLRFTRNSNTYSVWGFAYPLSFAYWLGGLSQDVQDPQMRQHLIAFVRWGIKLGGRVEQRLRDQWKDAKQRIFHLNAALIEAQEIATRLRSQHAMLAPEQRHILETDLDAELSIAQTVQAFVQRWLKAQEDVIILDGITIDAEGNDLNQPITLPLFAAVDQTDADLLADYEQWVAEWTAKLQSLLRP
jgi:hypothetical protein